MSLLRLSSYGSSPATTTHGNPKSPASPAPHPPTEALPPSSTGASPAQILANRAQEIKRIPKHLAAYFTALATAHHSHSVALAALAHPSKSPLPVPFAESSLFLPPSQLPANATSGVLGGTGGEGWQHIFADARATAQRTADAHAELARRVNKEVVGPLMKLRVEMKTHIQLMERDTHKLTDLVVKERDTTAPLLQRLSLSLTQSSLPLSAPSLQPSEDPVLLRALVEAQLQKQVDRENELLECVKTWTRKTEEREREVFEEVKRCWAVWEQVNSATLLTAQQHSMFLSATVDSIPSDAEWAHFLKLNHALPLDARKKAVADVAYDGRGDRLTGVVKEGMLERQTSFLRSWKPAYFLLTPSGHLHVYPPPPPSSPSASAPSSPTAPDSVSVEPSSAADLPPLTPSATHLLLHSTPLLSLNLALCTLGPMPPPTSSSSSSEAQKALDPVFTLIESAGPGGVGQGSGTRHVVRVAGLGKGKKDGNESGEAWEEMSAWVGEIGQFCAAPPLPPSPVSATSSGLLSPSSAQPPPALPARALPLGQSPALPSLPTFPAGETPPPPPLPPRDGATGGAEEDLEVTPQNRLRSSLVISESDALDYAYTAGDPARDSMLSAGPDSPSAERRMFEGLGLAASAPPPVPPRDAPAAASDGEGESDDEDPDAGDLGRSLPPSGGAGAASSLRRVPPAPVSVPRSGSVRSLAAAWESNSTALSPPLNSGGSQLASPRERDEYATGDVTSPGSAGRDNPFDLEDVVEGPPRSTHSASAAGSVGERSPEPTTVELAPESPAPEDGGGEKDGEDEGKEGEGEETPSEPATPRQGGKKGKKKRKSKGGAKAQPTERPLPLPSLDPEHADLGVLPSQPGEEDFKGFRRREGEEEEVALEVEREDGGKGEAEK
ncbi:hypothetical protein JCM10207_007058 [Rhodosporidiobolus poonsookiae]